MVERMLTYERLGADATHGFNFEIGLTSLAYLRCEKLHKKFLRNNSSGVKTFFVANNVKNIGALDDVVIRVEYLEENTIRTKLIFVQCKHLANVASTSDKKYNEYLNNIVSVQKYFNSFQRIYQILQKNMSVVSAGLSNQEREERLQTFLDSEFEDCEFIFYSNIDRRSDKNLGFFEILPRNSEKSITENLLSITETNFLRLKINFRNNLVCSPQFEYLKTLFCEKFTVILNQEGNFDAILTREISLIQKMEFKMINAMYKVFKEEIERHFNDSNLCDALSENTNLVEKTIAYAILKCKSVETISQFQKNSRFEVLFSEATIEILREKFINQLENPLVVSTNFKDLEKRKLVQLFLNFSDCIMFINNEENVKTWHLARQLRVYKNFEEMKIFSEITFEPPIRNLAETNEKIVQIVCNKTDNDSLPDIEEFSDESKLLIRHKNVCFQGHSQDMELGSICENRINFLFDEKMICEILEERNELKFCDSLEKPEFYINRTFKEKKLKLPTFAQKSSIDDSYDENCKLLLLSENNTNIPNVGKSYVWFENLKHARKVLRSIPESTNDTFHVVCVGSVEKLLYSFGKESKFVDYTVLCEDDLITGQTKMSKIIILSDIAGMGKSTTLKFLANKYKNKYPSHWVFFIELNKYLEEFNNFQDWSDIRLVVQFVATHLINLKNHECRAFVNACIETGNVAIFFDAFDEISPDAEVNFTLLLDTLESTKIFYQFVSSRPNYVRRLEQHFFQTSIEFVPLEFEEIVNFFYAQWKSTLLKDAMDTEVNESEFKTSVCNFLTEIRHSLTDALLKIPMKMKMIAELFHDKFKLFLQKADFEAYSKIDIYTLYNDFCNLHAKRYLIEKEGQDWNKKKERNKKIAVEAELKGIEKIACKIICPNFDIPEDEDMTEVNTIMCDHLGLLTHINPPRLFHRTYGEFFTAKYISKQLCTRNVETDTKFMSVLFENILLHYNYEYVRKFINSAFSNESLVNKFHFSQVGIPVDKEIFKLVLFKAVLENNLDILKFTLLFNSDSANVRNGGGNTLLMVACEKDKTDIAKYLISMSDCLVDSIHWDGTSALHYAIQCENINIINFLLNRDLTLLNIPNNKHAPCGFTALHIACKLNKCEAAKHLLSYADCLVNLVDNKGNTALNYAAKSGNIELIKCVLNHDPTMLYESDANGATLLHEASKLNKLDVVEYLIRNYDFKTNMVDWCRQTALHYAASFGSIDIVEFLLQHDKSLINNQECNGFTALHIACKSGKYAVVKCILSYSDCLVNVEASYGNTALHFAARSRNEEIVKLLLQRDQSMINRQNYAGKTALHIAMNYRNYSVISCLLSHPDCLVHVKDKAKKNAIQYLLLNLNEYKTETVDLLPVISLLFEQDVNGDTALHIACLVADIRLVTHLITLPSCGDRTLLNMQNSDGMTPLHFACKSNKKNASIVVEFLLTLPDFKVSVVDSAGKYAIHYAVDNLNLRSPITNLLLEKDVTLLNKQDLEGNTPLIIACKNGTPAVANLLLSYPDCVVNYENTKKRNSLHYATENGCTEIMKIILERDKTLLKKQDRDGMTPLHIACKKEKNEAAKLLLSYQDCVENLEDITKKNSLHYATENGCTEIMKIILERDKTLLNKKDIDGMTPLHIACKKKNTETVNFLLSYKDCSVNLQDEGGKCAIHYAAKGSCVENLKLILERDYTLLNKKDINDMTSVHIACERHEFESAQYLPSYLKCEVSTLDKRKRNVLHYASNVDTIKLILEHDFSLLNKKDIDGNTPLHLMFESNQDAAAEYLISLSDCLISVQNNMKQTPFHCGNFEFRFDSYVKLSLERDNTLLNKQDINGQTLIHKYFERGKNISYFIHHKYFKVDLKDSNGNTFLHSLAKLKYDSHAPEWMKVLLERNPQLLNMQNINCQSALHIAALQNNENVLYFLLNISECNVSLKDKNSDTPLHLFINSLFQKKFAYFELSPVDGVSDDLDNEHTHSRVFLFTIKQFIRRDPFLLNMKNNTGQTPLHIAVFGCKFRIVRYLLYLGADTDQRDKNGNKPLDLAHQLEDSLEKQIIVYYLQNHQMAKVAGD